MPQWDKHGAIYTQVKSRPIPMLQNRHAEEALGDLSGMRVLDAACGTGFFSQRIAAIGATEVVGIDISPGMIENARAELSNTEDRIRYLVGDFEEADLLGSVGLEAMKGTFDVVFAGYLLNYAADWQRMAKMFNNISLALKPGGRLIALIPNPFLLEKCSPENEGGYGDTIQILETYDYGYKVHLIAKTETFTFEFDMYRLYVSEYEKAAKHAGFQSLDWQQGRQRPHANIIFVSADRVL